MDRDAIGERIVIGCAQSAILGLPKSSLILGDIISLDLTSGSGYNAPGRNGTGDWSLSPADATGPTWVTEGLSFDGVNDVLSHANVTTGLSESFYIHAHIKTPTAWGTDTYQPIFTSGPSGSPYWAFLQLFTAARRFIFYLYDGSNSPHTYAVSVSLDTEYHITAWRSTSDHKLNIVVNNGSILQVADTTTTVPAYSCIRIGIYEYMNWKLKAIVKRIEVGTGVATQAMHDAWRTGAA